MILLKELTMLFWNFCSWWYENFLYNFRMLYILIIKLPNLLLVRFWNHFKVFWLYIETLSSFITIVLNCCLKSFTFINYNWLSGSVGWGCGIHRLQICRVVKLPRLSWIWHETIYWWRSSDAGALGNAEYPFVTIALGSTLTWSGSTW